MEAVATIGACGLSIVNKPLQYRLKDEVKIAFDNATGNKIFARKYKIEKFEGKMCCIVKECKANFKNTNSLKTHCIKFHDILISYRDIFIFHIELKERKNRSS